jgi:PKD repeat protein
VTDANVPFTASFTDQSPNAPSSWDWAFGDGATSADQNPSHDYTVPGVYDVSLKITEARGLGEENLNNYVWARADTLKIDSQIVDRGTKPVFNVYLSNTAQVKTMLLALSMTNPEGITLDSFSIAGTRTSTFIYAGYDGGDHLSTFGLDLRSNTAQSDFLPVGAGNIAKLYLNIPSTAALGAVVTIDTLSLGTTQTKKPRISAVYGDYWPVFTPGKIVVRACVRGKVLCGSGSIDLTDLSLLISYMISGTPTLDPYGGNVNAVGGIDLSDLSYLINYLIANGDPPPTN